MPSYGVKLNMDKLLEIERQLPGRAAASAQKMAQDAELYISLHWNPESPSPEGEAPGVDTGNLKNSIMLEPGDSALEWILKVIAAYGVHLEYGTENMAARPFVLPAVEWVAENAPDDLIEVVTG